MRVFSRRLWVGVLRETPPLVLLRIYFFRRNIFLVDDVSRGLLVDSAAGRMPDAARLNGRSKTIGIGDRYHRL